jgi:hypothetical protein
VPMHFGTLDSGIKRGTIITWFVGFERRVVALSHDAHNINQQVLEGRLGGEVPHRKKTRRRATDTTPGKDEIFARLVW